jgi:tetratricopeptide (TPR) repeat protein
VSLPAGAEPPWTSNGGSHRLSLRLDKAKLDGMLTIVAAPGDMGRMILSEGPAGERFFEISDAAAGAGVEAATPGAVAILWDRSLSRGDDSIAAEIELVRGYLEQLRPKAVDLILFDSSGLERHHLADAPSVVERLSRVTYRGGSSLAVLARAKLAADTCLLFSDGLVTIDSRTIFNPGCALTAISSAPESDRALLGAFARASGGETLHLGQGNSKAVLARLTRKFPRVVDVRSESGAALEYALLDAPSGGWRVVGRAPASGGVVLRIAGTGLEATERSYRPGASRVALWSGAAALWASHRLALLAAAEERDRDALVRFARRYSVAGPDVSFIVLESGADYAEAGIEPPADLPEGQIAEYRKLAAEAAQEERTERDGHLNELIKAWEEQKNWWRTRFDPRAKPAQKPRNRTGSNAVPVPLPPSPVSPSPAGPRGIVAPVPSDEEIVVTGTVFRTTRSASASPITVVTAEAMEMRPGIALNAISAEAGAVSEVTIVPWAADRPYLAALAAAPGDSRERVLVEQQAKHGALPAFWLDTSEYFHRAGQRDEALRLLLSALELPARDNETVAIVAQRLIRYGELDRGIDLLERVVASEPDRPQPLRSLALALAKRAEATPGEAARNDLVRAIGLLTRIIMEPSPEGFEGIELIALMEVNRLIPRYRDLGGSDVPLDPRLVALLDVDIRVVIEWSTEETDLDLWVDEPNGERALYNNPRTAIGGHMSADMTEGFGPEEYLLRHAPVGTFTVRADTYAADALNPNGPSRVTAHLFRNYGRADEREEIVELELLPKRGGDEDDESDGHTRLVGRIRFRR